MTTGRARFLETLKAKKTDRPPVWFMRQAGRYLPEYRATRAEAGSFLDLCYNPELAAEVTFQPIRRYGFDAAILFADILLVPHALGQDVSFVHGEGPKLAPVTDADGLAALSMDGLHDHLAPVYETVRRLKEGLKGETALIGFAGAPWTVATYMIAGGGVKDPAGLRSYRYQDPDFVRRLMAMLIEATAEYLIAQVKAGAEAVQLFDTWAGGLPEDLTVELSLKPMTEIAARVKAAYPDVPVILFPKGVGPMLKPFAEHEAADAVGIDFAMPWDWARREISPHAVVQGGLDPLLLVGGGEAMETAARRLLRTFEDVPYVFNLGHGLTPDIPPENVGRLVEIARGAV